jgi:hypothetical protein
VAYVDAFFSSDRPHERASFAGIRGSPVPTSTSTSTCAPAWRRGWISTGPNSWHRASTWGCTSSRLGLGHPNGNNPEGVETNYDTDFNPLNAMVIDPADPFGDLIVSGNRDDLAIMSNAQCGYPLVAPCPAFFFTSLRNDDLGGRDALYPIPEPTAAFLLALGLAGLAAAGRRS